MVEIHHKKEEVMSLYLFQIFFKMDNVYNDLKEKLKHFQTNLILEFFMFLMLELL
jgi:hypothetical protein